MVVPRRLLLKNIPDSHHSSTLTAWSASVGGEKSESAPSRFTGKDRRPRYPSFNSPDAGTRVHYDRALTDQHFTVRICANLPLHGILSPSLGPTHQRYAYCLNTSTRVDPLPGSPNRFDRVRTNRVVFTAFGNTFTRIQLSPTG